MAFWSGERLDQELKTHGLVAPFKPGNLDCASYRLSVGEQVFATSDKFRNSGPSDPIIQVLAQAPNHTLRIPPGQFAFLLTDEVVKVPSNAIALISMRARYKLKGLINVSGFHVDPGWSGKLLFSVYNAGPAELVVAYGESMFLIVYADLDQDSKLLYNGSSQDQTAIQPSLLEGMGSQVFSPLMLQRKVDDLTSKIDTVERSMTARTDTVDRSMTTRIDTVDRSMATRIEAAERSITLSKTIAFALGTFAGVFLGGVAVFATYAPATLGLIVGSVLQAGGYELKLKAADAPISSQSESVKNSNAQTTASQSANQPSTLPAKPSSATKR